MRTRVVAIWLGALALGGCASPLDRAEALYRQGALHEAVEAWRAVPSDHRDRARAEERLALVQGELERMLKRFEKQAAFFEANGQLGEAILYYRLALKMDPGRDATLEHVQALVRELEVRKAAERERMLRALGGGDLAEASTAASELQRLTPYDPAIQIEVRQVRHAIGAEVLSNLEVGKRSLQRGDLDQARERFEVVMGLDPSHEEAGGWIGFIEEEQRKAQRRRSRPVDRIVARSLKLDEVSPREISAESHYRRGRKAELAERKFEALRQYERALRESAHHLKARSALARLRRELMPRIPTLYAEGKRYFNDEDLQNALRSWEHVLLIQPDHAQAAENLQRAQRILSRLEELQQGGS